MLSIGSSALLSCGELQDPHVKTEATVTILGPTTYIKESP